MVRSLRSDAHRRFPVFSLATLMMSAICALTSSPLSAQTTERASYTITSGVLGAANASAFRVTGTPVYDQRVGWAAGAWLNLPMGRFFSLEPQVQFSVVPSLQQAGTGPAFLDDVSVHHASVPLLLKLHLKWIALSVGGQIDVPISVVDEPNKWTLEDIAPFSAGVTGGVELFPRSRVSLYGRYAYGLTGVDERDTPDPANTFYNQGVQAGLRIRLFGSGRGAPRVVRAPRDTVDECAVKVGADRPARCPLLDSDSDGILDRADKCPQASGTARFEGCPTPDRDGDGVLDDVDECPAEVGLVKDRGCAPKDADRDGITDAEDRCPTVLGARENMGCPRIISFTAEHVTFASGSDVLTSSGKSELNKVVEYMRMYPDVKIKLSGHTDNTGSDAINNPLSERRAAAAKAYIVSRSIDADRVSAEGHGSARPTMGNGTAAGRARNRRVEATVR